MGRGIKLAAMHVGDYVAPDSGANPDCWVGSSMVEQRPFKPLAVGSSPTRPTTPFFIRAWPYRIGEQKMERGIHSGRLLP